MVANQGWDPANLSDRAPVLKPLTAFATKRLGKAVK
jgi:hypothetical protein